MRRKKNNQVNIKKNNQVNVKNKLKHKDKLTPYGRVEFIFDLFSLLILIGLGFYFGGRSIYYYSLQNTNIEKAATTLNGTIITNNSITTTEDGLHQDMEGYYYKGNVENNYVYFANRLYRIIRINNDGSTKVVSNDIVSEFMWGEDEDYQKSNIHNWLEKQENIENSGIYYDTIPYLEEFLVKTTYNIPIFNENKVMNSQTNYNDYITTLTIKDYNNANGKNGYLNIHKYFWILGNDSEKNNYYVDEEGALLTGNLYESYGIRPVFTFKKDIEITGGSGTKEDPYKIDQKDKINYVDSYVNINGDIWKVYYHKDKIVKLAYTNYVLENQNLTYSNTTSEFDPKNRKNIAYYLNNQLYNSLSYKDYLLDFNIYTGEVSSDTSLYYENIYTSFVTGKVGLQNLFDYHNVDLDDYYLSNTTSSVGSMVYIYHNYGLLEEANVSDVKKIVPVISISEENIHIENKDGTSSNPYTVG